jgi:murein DD-endopeptidase MepM/ murein hydrolase activator NlpD
MEEGERKNIFQILAIFSIAFVFLFQTPVSLAQQAANPLVEEISELDRQMEAKKKEIEELKKKSATYQKNIEEAKRKALSLETELAILSNRIVKTKIDIEATEKNIEEIKLELKNIELQIKEKERNLAENRKRMADILRLISRADRVNYLHIIAAKKSFSEVFDQIQYTKELQINLQGVLDKIKGEKSELENKENEKQEKQKEEERDKSDLEKLQASLGEQAVRKEVLLSETFANEKKFQNWLLEAKYEQEQINSDIYSIERNIRQKLEESDKNFSGEKGTGTGSIALSWPVSPARGITATFHDPDYPYRYVFEHPAIDIRAAQGTKVAAAAPGYVARIKNGGSRGYSYVMIIHNNNVSTVYGHLSRIDVQEDTYVIRGQIIGLSGGMPGTPGAGGLTTGPHLHFETRLNGIPVNPLNYLP